MRSPRRISDINIDYKTVGSAAQEINADPAVECAYIRIVIVSRSLIGKIEKKKQREDGRKNTKKKHCDTAFRSSAMTSWL